MKEDFKQVHMKECNEGSVYLYQSCNMWKSAKNPATSFGFFFVRANYCFFVQHRSCSSMKIVYNIGLVQIWKLESSGSQLSNVWVSLPPTSMIEVNFSFVA